VKERRKKIMGGNSIKERKLKGRRIEGRRRT
jgi:hypothetical protein